VNTEPANTEPANTGIGDGDLVRLARDGDGVAFRLLVERHQPMARASARAQCANPSDVDDVVQESFLRAFIGLDRLRDPDRFAGWLRGIVANVCRGLNRGPTVVLVPELPEPLHPATRQGLPSAEDLDRATVLRAAVAGLPAGQRRAVALRYYADLPADQIADPPGAARASLHKARHRLRAYLAEHRPDLVPTASRRTPMTIVRVERRIPPGPVPIGFPTHVIVLADDAGHRALPLWVEEIALGPLRQLVEPHAADDQTAGTDQANSVAELTAVLLRAAGATVIGVDIDEIGPELAVAQIKLRTPAGIRTVAARVAEGLAVAVTAVAPVRVADTAMDRLAVPMSADGQVPLPEPEAALSVLEPPRRPRYEPRNLAFADGLNGWRLGGSFAGHASHSHWQDYSGRAADGVATLSATVPEPAGFAYLGQEIFADDYRGASVTFSGEFRVRVAAPAAATGRAGMFLRVSSPRDAGEPRTEHAAINDPANSIVGVPGHRDWTSYQVTARVRDDADAIMFGVFLQGPGRIEMRGPDLASDA